MDFSSIARKSLLGKIVRAPFSLIPSNTQMPIVQGPLRFKKWIVGSAIHGCWLGSYEYDKQRLFIREIRPGDIVYDLGANVGFYTLLASVLVGEAGRVFSFEPSPRNLHYLRKHMEINRVANCAVWDTAVGREEGSGMFCLGANPCVGRLGGGEDCTIPVRIVDIDSRVAAGTLPPPHLIKCDIEGGEFDALCGARETLRRHRPTILLATHGVEVHGQCLGLLRDLDYELAPIDDLPLERTCEVFARPRRN